MIDLYLKNGRDIESNAPLEIGILGQKIVSVGAKLEQVEARKTVDLKGKYVSAGWIDDHVHC